MITIAKHLTRLTLIGAVAAAGLSVHTSSHAAPVRVVELPRVVITFKQARVVELERVVVTGRRLAPPATLVAQRAPRGVASQPLGRG